MSATFNLEHFNQRREATRIFQEQKDNKQAFTKFNRKSKMCKNLANCKYGKSCTFAHDPSEIRAPRCVYGEACKNRSTTCVYDHSPEPKTSITSLDGAEVKVQTRKSESVTSLDGAKVIVQPPQPIVITFDEEEDEEDEEDEETVLDKEEDKEVMKVVNGNYIPQTSAINHEVMTEAILNPVAVLQTTHTPPQAQPNIEQRIQAQDFMIQQLQESIRRQQEVINYILSLNNQRNIQTTVSPIELLMLQQSRK